MMCLVCYGVQHPPTTQDDRNEKVREYRFTVDPKETEDSRNVRWDKQLLELQATGYTIKGCGPDGDYPLRYEPNPYDLGGPFVEIYEAVPLATQDGAATVPDLLANLQRSLDAAREGR